MKYIPAALRQATVCPALLFLLLIFGITVKSQVNLNQGLVAYYPFNGNANDVSGNGNNGTALNGIQLLADRFGNANSAYTFDGVDDYITVPNAASLNSHDAMSIAFYFNPSRRGVQTLIGKIDYNAPVATQYQVAMDFNLHPGVLFGVNPYASGCSGVPLNSNYVNTGTPPGLNQWHCIVATYDRGIQNIYLNGVLIESLHSGFTALNECTNATIQIGKWWTGDPQIFQGKIDDIRIYNRALTQEEVSSFCEIPASTCSNWLNVPTQPSWVNIGDVDVPGNKLTVEALINIKGIPPGGVIEGLDVVSKHTGPENVNYLLRSAHAELSTTNGYFSTPDACALEMNKTYHVAMVYDGTTLKYYRNGFLMGETLATGDMIQTDLPTGIGFISTLNQAENFIGYINEVRIWKVARTQNQIRAYMGSSLPSAATQTGLVSYHTFDNLLNKQGNPAWNGTLVGSASINQTNPECDFIADTCAVPVQPPCKQSLRVPNNNSKVRVGELDVSGKKITVEAIFNRTAPENAVGGYGFLVSKHTGPSNCNYALWTGGCAITTSVSGHHILTEICPVELNKTYHVAMVYDGATLKFYRNGVLHSQTPASGDLILNDLITTIGQNVPEGAPTIYPFLGYIDEVRIWNVARTEQQIRENMDKQLLDPTQPGLLAFYTFDNLQNKQGNTAWNGTAMDGAIPNQVDPQCTITPENCTLPSLCDKTLSLPSNGSKVTVGDVDVTGNKLTVEAMFNRTAPLNSGLYYGHLVSKHTDQSNVNYALLPNGCEITTDGSGYKAIFQDCPLIIGKTYHVAMVYDGAMLKFYRNGLLLSQTACTGNMINNDLQTTIAQLARGDDPANNQFIGYANEVRIWEEARTQMQIQTYMNQLLPDPSTQVNLVAYYSFNNLDNKQGTAAFNGTLHGGAVISKKNPDCAFGPNNCKVAEVTPDFTIPDTVCVNTPVAITNTSVNATSYYWNFCAAIPNTNPVYHGFGNPGESFFSPVFSDVVTDNGNYYVFVSNSNPGGLVRLDFGTSLSNYPTAVKLGNVGGVIPNTIQGIQVVKNEGRWYAIMVGGNPVAGISSRVIKIDFSANITNPNPTGTNWGNIGNLAFPIDLHLFQHDGEWFGFTANSQNNTITRFNFSGSFNNPPAAVNLGNLGGLDNPTGINVIKNNNNWYAFITNDVVNSFLVRLDFGNSLLNTPAAVNLGNPGNKLHKSRDISFMTGCGQIIGLALNGEGYRDIVKLDFNNNIVSTPTTISLQSGDEMYSPYSISKLVRDGNDLYGFVPNVKNNSFYMVRFGGCVNGDIPNSSAPDPGPVTYTAPGIYYINLTVDEGLPSQSSVCQKIVVKDCREPVLPGFAIPDTVCVNAPVIFKNTTAEPAANYYWNFCSADNKMLPEATNLGNIGGLLSNPVFMDCAFDKGNYYGFVVNNNPGRLIRLNFGNSLLNTPTATDLGNFGTVIPPGAAAMGIQITKNEQNGNWEIIIVSGNPSSGNEQRLLIVYFEDDLSASPWGAAIARNVGNMLEPLDFQVITENNKRYGFAISSGNNTLVRHALSTLTPLGINLGDFGLLDSPTGIYAMNDNGFWRMFITNSSNSKLVRLDFGSSILNIPTAVDLGSIGNSNGLRDLTLIKTCDQVTGFAINATTNTVLRLDFATLTSVPVVTDLGNLGGLSNPHSMLKFMRVNDDMFTFITNAGDNTLTRLKISGCTNAVPASSPIKEPPPVVYNTPGKYTVRLTVDEEMPSQSSVCKQIVVMPALEHKPPQNLSICEGESIQIGSPSTVGNYLWNDGSGTASIRVNSAGLYWVETSRFGCINRDSFAITVTPSPEVDLGADQSICDGKTLQLNAGDGGLAYVWNTGNTEQTIAVNAAGTYIAKVIATNGCSSSDTIHVGLYAKPVFSVSTPQPVCLNDSVQLVASGGDSYVWQPALGLNSNDIANPKASPAVTTDYFVTISEEVCNESITLSTRLTVLPPPSINATKSNDIDCSNDRSQLNASGGSRYAWSPALDLSNAGIHNPIARPAVTTAYIVEGTDLSGCKGYDTIVVKVDLVNNAVYEMPTAFTPNNDGLNDCYGIKYWGVVNELELSIYNRWGKRIFFTKNLNQCWDGTYKGVAQGGGVYVYMIRAKTMCQPEVFRKGTFVLIR